MIENGKQPFGVPISIVIMVFTAELLRAMATSAQYGYLPSLLTHFGVAEEDLGYYQSAIVTEYFLVANIAVIAVGKII